MPVTAFDSASCPLAELTQHIRDTHHAFLRAELPAIWTLLREAVAIAPGRDPGVRDLARLFGRFRASLENHLRKEEEVLFPFVEELERTVASAGSWPERDFGPLRLPIEILEAEHALGDRLLESMRPLWRPWTQQQGSTPVLVALSSRLDALEADMVRHVHVEDTVLFPRTIHLEGR